MQGRLTAMSTHNVLFLTESLNIGGSEVFLEKLLLHIDTRTFRPIVCCLVEKGRLAAAVEARGIRVVELGWNLNSKMSTLLVAVRLASLLRRERIDLVQTFFYRPEILAALAGVLARTPVIVATQYDMLGPEGKLATLLLRRSSSIVTHVIANCEACKTHRWKLTGRRPDSISVIYIGLTQEELRLGVFPEQTCIAQGYFEKGPVVTYAGRLYHLKGPDIFLRAAASLSRRNPHVRFLLLGDGPMRPELSSLSKELGIVDLVSMPGEIRPLGYIFSKSSAFVCSSRSEGLPSVVLEAMASGVPVVASRVGGVEELIQHGVDGFLFESEDWERLALLVETVLSNRELGSEMGRRAREKACRQFRFEQTVSNIEDVYRRLLASK
jgi:glycosyltransferase involved in cell wall biosynthesis